MATMRRGSVVLGALLSACLAPAALAATGAATRDATTPIQLYLVAIREEGTLVRVSIHGTAGLPAAEVKTTTEGAPRVFVDLPGVSPGRVPATTRGVGSVRRIRVAQYSLDPLITRVVLDLVVETHYAVVPGTPAVPEMTIVLGAPAAANTAVPRRSGPTPPPVRPAALPAAPPPTLTPPAVSGARLPVAQPPANSQVLVASQTPGVPPTAPQVPMSAPEAVQPPTAPRSMGFGAPRPVRPSGRVSMYVGGARSSQMGGDANSYGDVTSSVTYELTDRETDGVEYGLDVRHSAYSIAGREPRVSVYTGYVGARLLDGAVRARAGHLWLDDLGGLGALAGAQLEGRSAPLIPTKGFGRWRGGLFGGLEPNIYTLGYEEGVRKAGGYVALEGARGRRHLAGYVNVHNGSFTERSVLTVTNFVPAGPLYVYQAAEYDLVPSAGGRGHDGLTYFFSNARVNAGRRLEFLGTLSRGRSVDTRGLSDDIQAGRPVTQQAIDGLRYESIGGRATVEVMPRVRVYGGYSRDKNNRDDAPTGRWLVGGFGGNVFGSGVDLTYSDSRTLRPDGSYHSRYASVGRELGQRVYATAEYSTALSQVRFVRGDGLVIDTRPETTRAGLSASVLLWRSTSFVLNVERTMGDDYTELRVLTGLTYRLR